MHYPGQRIFLFFFLFFFSGIMSTYMPNCIHDVLFGGYHFTFDHEGSWVEGRDLYLRFTIPHSYELISIWFIGTQIGAYVEGEENVNWKYEFHQDECIQSFVGKFDWTLMVYNAQVMARNLGTIYDYLFEVWVQTFSHEKRITKILYPFHLQIRRTVSIKIKEPVVIPTEEPTLEPTLEPTR